MVMSRYLLSSRVAVGFTARRLSADPMGGVSLNIVSAHIRNDANDRAPALVSKESDVLPDAF